MLPFFIPDPLRKSSSPPKLSVASEEALCPCAALCARYPRKPGCSNSIFPAHWPVRSATR
nr:MAG TPA: hypothetical protein [Bacteriophage sp.]